MHLLIINKNGIAAKSMSLRSFFLLTAFVIVLTAYIAIEAFKQLPPQLQISSNFNSNLSAKDEPNSTQHNQIKKILSDDRQSISQLEKSLNAQLDFVSLQLAQMQAKLIHMDSISEQLVKKNELVVTPFPLSKVPALGGPIEEPSSNEDSEKRISKLNHRLDAIANEINTYSEQLKIYEAIYDRQYLQHSTFPSGKPSDSGWISSYFGARKDPFTGKRAQHKGIDVAAKDGDLIIATAKGVITWAGKRSGYGKLIEITHGNNLVTRYGHCKSIGVQIGDIVQQGQPIGEIGSTGRSTGPHVHYEVLKNNVKLNPISFVKKKSPSRIH